MSLRALTALGSIAYVATLVIVPLLNPALDALRVHPEDFAQGNAGVLVNVGYAALALALIGLALAAFGLGGLAPRTAAVCFAVAAVTCVANAIDPTLGTRRSPVELGVFGLAVGPLILSLRLGSRVAVALAVAALAAFVALITWGDGDLGGMVNRIFNGLAALSLLALALVAPMRRGGIMRPSGEVA